jgi:predicted patatin/cPLA2 family phospholipase
MIRCRAAVAMPYGDGGVIVDAMPYDDGGVIADAMP